jgi:2-polyprenyl-3-methyl-5-hydroxy-6-metoxy-1,4-benzoquinol methylase
MMSDDQIHWQGVYTTKSPDAVSWFQPLPEPSCKMMDMLGVEPPARVVDIGGGASGLVDVLIGRGFEVTVLDIAEAALAAVRKRLGAAASKADWQIGDIRQWRPVGRYDLWHDRAVFHFLTSAEDRALYLSALNAGVAPGGAVILATFAEDGPEQCSGLPVRRYSADQLTSELGPGFTLVHHSRETHRTPWGSEQSFTWVGLRRVSL